MINSISSGNAILVNTNSLQTPQDSNAKAANDTGTIQNSSSSASADSSGTKKSVHEDTVVISQEAQQAQTNNASSNNVSIKESNDTGSETKSSVQSTSTTSSSNTNNLSQYTDYQLKKMLSAGTISQSQYNTEIAQRQKNASSVSSDKV